MKHFFLLSLISFSVACGERFEPFSLVNSTRVMAIQSSEPEVRPGEETVLSALVFVPPGKDVTYAWDWCPFRTNAVDKFECPFTQEELIELISENLPDGTPMVNIPLEDFDLGSGQTATLKYPAPQPFLQAICNGIQEAAVDAAEDLAINIPVVSCEDGYEISVRLVVTGNGKTETAAKRVNLWLGGEQPKDTNPKVSDIRIRPKEEDKQTLIDAGHTWVSEINDFENDWYVLPADKSTPILVGLKYDIDSFIDEGTIQVYAKRAPDGSPDKFLDAKREIIEFQWLTTFGSFSQDQVLYFSEDEDLAARRQTEIFFPSTDLSQEPEVSNGEAFVDNCPELNNADTSDGCIIDIWSVLRDDRLGAGWMKRSLIATGVSSASTEVE